jgi:hypothetical protein
LDHRRAHQVADRNVRNGFDISDRLETNIDQSNRLIDDTMTREVHAAEAKTHLSQALDEVERGETINSTRLAPGPCNATCDGFTRPASRAEFLGEAARLVVPAIRQLGENSADPLADVRAQPITGRVRPPAFTGNILKRVSPHDHRCRQVPFARQPIKDGAEQFRPGVLLFRGYHSATPPIRREMPVQLIIIYWIYDVVPGRPYTINQLVPNRPMDEAAKAIRRRFTPPVVVKNFGDYLVNGALDFGTFAHSIETADQQIAVFSPPSDEDTFELV